MKRNVIKALETHAFSSSVRTVKERNDTVEIEYQVYYLEGILHRKVQDH